MHHLLPTLGNFLSGWDLETETSEKKNIKKNTSIPSIYLDAMPKIDHGFFVVDNLVHGCSLLLFLWRVLFCNRHESSTTKNTVRIVCSPPKPNGWAEDSANFFKTIMAWGFLGFHSSKLIVFRKWSCCLVWLPSRELTYPPDKAYLKMMFLFRRWDMLIFWRVLSCSTLKVEI